MYSEDVIRRVRDSINVYDLISGYVALKKTGKNWLGLCPFHSEKTPSFNVNTEKQIFHCFGCGVGGDVFKFVELQEGLNFPEAVKTLAARAGITLPQDTRDHRQDKRTEDEKKTLLTIVAEASEYFKKELAGPAGSGAREYLRKRGVSDAIVREFGLGYVRPEWDGLLKHLKQQNYTPAQMERAGLVVKRSEGEGYYDRFRGRLIFPIRDMTGQVIAFGGRVMDDSLPKYLNSSETALYSKSHVLYGLDMAKDHGRKQGYFIIVEGYLDAIACHQYGIRNAVATLGTALTDGHLRLMRRFADKLVLIFDPDPAGVKASLRGFDLFVSSSMKVNVVSLPGGDDPDTFLQKQGQEAFAARLRESSKFMDFVIEQVVKNSPSSGIDEKREKAEEMLSYISRLPSVIERNHYIKKTAETLELDETALLEEMQKQAAKHPHVQAGAVPAATARVRRPQAEEMLIHLILRDEEIAKEAKDRLQPQDFTEPLFQRAAERIFSVLSEHGKLDAVVLLQEEDEELRKLISYYSVLEIPYDFQEKSSRDDIEQSFRDCVALIKQKDPEKKMKLLIKAMQEAEARGDAATIKQLIEEQQELSRRPGRKIPGKSGTSIQ
jgi:DNA primase